jgi:type I restriction enzyme M protein
LPANIFTERDIPLYFGLEEKAKTKTFCLLTPANISKVTNVLRKEDDKIISTFETKPKINTATCPFKVETNDYNLNIPRYVDTFEEEEAIDLSHNTELRNWLFL